MANRRMEYQGVVIGEGRFRILHQLSKYTIPTLLLHTDPHEVQRLQEEIRMLQKFGWVTPKSGALSKQGRAAYDSCLTVE